MRILAYIIAFIAFFSVFIAASSNLDSIYTSEYIAKLREMYAKDSKEWEAAHIDSGVEYSELAALPKSPPYPKDNPFDPTNPAHIAKLELGKKLFNDPRLSKSNQIACASCHDSELGFSNGRSVAFGHNRAVGRRNVPSVVMSAFNADFNANIATKDSINDEKFWDGRAPNLETQVFFPISDINEMASSIDEVAEKLANIEEYQKAFRSAFGEQNSKNLITPENIAKAIATYERSLMPKNSKFDRFMNAEKGDKKGKILSDDEIVGLHIFRTKGRCMNCHNGAAFSDFKYHSLGLSFYGTKWQDLGRYEVSGKASDSGKFRTPTLRNIAKTAPYMHNGRFPNLQIVLKSYNAGMYHLKPKNDKEANDPLFPKTDPLLKPLHLTPYELSALEAFLRSL